MRYYLDTVAIRSLNRKLSFLKNENVYTSWLAIFELISGITEDEYEKRKGIIETVLNSGISIDWMSCIGKMHSAYKVTYNDIDSVATKTMAKIIIKSKCLQDINQICEDQSEWFRLETFSKYDEMLSKLGIEVTKEGADEWRKEYDIEFRRKIKKDIKENELIKAFVFQTAGLMKIEFTEKIAGSKRPSDKYFEYINRYDESMNRYFEFVQLQYALAILEGRNMGTNDTVDALHMLYLNEDDILVSNDTIFKKMCGIETDMNVISIDKFKAQVLNKTE